MIDALNNCHASEQKILEGLNQVFGSDLGNFAETQPSQIKEALKALQKIGSQQVQVLGDWTSSVSTLTADLQTLKVLRQEMSRRASAAKAADERAHKSSVAAEKARTNLASLESKGGSEAEKAKVIEQNARFRMERDKQNAEKVKDESSQACDDLKQRFSEKLAGALRSAAEKREKVCERMSSIAREMTSAVDQFQDYEDSVVNKLKQRLKDLEFEVVD